MSNLKNELENRNVEQLKNIARALNITGFSKLKKADLIELLRPVLLTPKVAYKIFVATEFKELNIFNRALKSPIVITKNAQIYEISYLSSFCYLGIDDNANIYVPHDVISLFNKIYTKEFMKEHRKCNDILQYIKALVNLYGIVSTEKIAEIYNLQNEEKIYDDDITKVMILTFPHPHFFEYYKGNLVHESLLFEDGAVEMLSYKQGEKPFYIPKKEKLLNYADDLYLEVTPEYEDLRKAIQEEFKLKKEMTEYICEDIQLHCEMESNLQEILDEFERRDIKFTDLQQVNRLVALITNLMNNTRIWSNRGHIPIELNNAFKANIIPSIKQPYKTNKTGRNEPCPCGSGIKYKKCCGR